MRGAAWVASYRLFEIGLSFAAMLLLVRIVPPEDYGRAGMAIGILALFNTFSARGFIAHAVQLPGDQEPDWTMHWAIAWRLQALTTLACESAAAAMWFVPAYRPVAPLLAVAGLGLLVDAPCEIGATMLRRELSFQRLKLIAAACVIVRLLTVISLAACGYGALGIVLGGNVLTSLPYGWDLLITRGWRPANGWWERPRWREYRASAVFGLQQIASGLVANLGNAIEALVLPGAVGYAAIGLLDRSQGLCTATVGRVTSVIQETAYPFLPQAAEAPDQFRRQATRFLEVVLLIAVPAAMFLGLEGRAVSRVLYGQKWIAMDPLIWPGALAGLGVLAFVTASSVLLAANRLRTCFILDSVNMVLALPAVGLAWSTRSILAYAWIVAVLQLLAALSALLAASTVLVPRWYRSGLVPAVTATAGALVVAWSVGRWWAPSLLFGRLVGVGIVYAAMALVVLRTFHRQALSDLLAWLPGGQVARKYLRLEASPVEARAA